MRDSEKYCCCMEIRNYFCGITSKFRFQMPYIIIKSNEFGKDVEISLPYAHGNVANDRLIPSELRCHIRPASVRPYVLVPPVGTRTVRATTTAAETLSLLERNGWKVIGMAGISSNAVQTDAHLVWTMWKEGSRE